MTKSRLMLPRNRREDMRSRQQLAAARTTAPMNSRQRMTWAILPLTAAFVFLAGMVSAEEVTKSHAVSNFGSVKYPADFTHLDYVNPDAPKGGEISQWDQSAYDSFNRYARDGVSAPLTELLYESILTGTADDAYGAYCDKV